MIKIRLATSVKGIDKSAYFPLSHLILRFLLLNDNIGSVSIYKDEITFDKAVFFRKGEIKFYNNNLECRDGIIYYIGETQQYNYVNKLPLSYLASIMRALKPGYYCNFSF